MAVCAKVIQYLPNSLVGRQLIFHNPGTIPLHITAFVSLAQPILRPLKLRATTFPFFVGSSSVPAFKCISKTHRIDAGQPIAGFFLEDHYIGCKEPSSDQESGHSLRVRFPAQGYASHIEALSRLATSVDRRTIPSKNHLEAWRDRRWRKKKTSES